MPLSALQASTCLHHLHPGSPDPAAMAGHCSGAMEMTAETQPDGAIPLQGSARRLLTSKGRAKKLVQAGLALRGEKALHGLRDRAAAHGVAAADAAAGLFRPGASVADPDGNSIVFDLAADAPAAGPPAPGQLRGPLQRLTPASSDIDALQAFHAGKLGSEPPARRDMTA